MATNYSPKIVTEGLVLALDAANIKSYPGSGTAWNDMSGNGRHATMQGTMNISNGSTVLAAGDYATIPHDSVISASVFGTSTTLTLSTWCKITTFQNWTCMISKAFGGSWSNTTAALWADASGAVRFVMGCNVNSNPAGSSINPGFIVPTNTWVNVTGVADGTNAILYVNGVQRATSPISSLTYARTENANDITIGVRAVGAGPSHLGNIATVQVYDKTLTADEVKQNFEATRSRFGI
jgi:hypothetical protein